MLRLKLATVAVVLAAMGMAGPAAAQRPPGAPAGRPGGQMTPDSILAKMSKRLNLTAAQKAKIKPMLQDEQKKMMDLMNDHSTPNDQKFAKMRTMRDTYQAKLKKTLTPDQQKKMDQWQAEMRARFQHPPGGGPGGPPTR